MNRTETELCTVICQVLAVIGALAAAWLLLTLAMA